MMSYQMILNHLWQSTLVVGLAAWLVKMVDRRHAATRFRIWQFASLKFLIPFGALSSLGAWGTSWMPAVPALTSWPSYVERAVAPFAIATTPAVGDLAATGFAEAYGARLVLFAWACGVLVCAARKARQLMAAARLRRRAVVCHDGSIVEAARRVAGETRTAAPVVAETPDLLEPGVAGLLRSTLLWPAALTSHLSATQRDGVIAHELAHIRRRDNVWRLIHGYVEALFWFHPVVWLVGARLRAESERACDQAALETGAQPQDYAEGLLAVSRLCLRVEKPALAGVLGSGLADRVEVIMSSSHLSPLRLGTRVCLVSVAAALLAGPIALGAVSGEATRVGWMMRSAEAVSAGAVSRVSNPPAQVTERQTTEASQIRAGARAEPVASGPMAQAAAKSGPAPTPAPDNRAAQDAPAPSPEDMEFYLGAYQNDGTPGLVAPVVVRRAVPLYTAEALRAKLAGTVAVDVVVGTDGRVTRSRVVSSLDTVYGLDRSALNASALWLFEPGTLNGEPVPVVCRIELEFRLR